MANWQRGDVVQLKSGGPHMTVQEIDDDGDVECQWFVDKDLKFGVFPPESLQKPTGGSSLPFYQG